MSSINLPARALKKLPDTLNLVNIPREGTCSILEDTVSTNLSNAIAGIKEEP